MRRLFFAALALVAIALIAGCGSSKKSAASSPVIQTLSYFPPSAPFVLTVPTDPQSPGIKNAKALQQRFPAVALAQTALFARLAQIGINYNKQIKPLFGNPFAIGVLSIQSGASSQSPFLGVWVTKNGGDLAALVKKLGAGLQSTGSHDGAKLYQSGGQALAIDGPTLLIARTAQDINAALDRHQNSGGFTSAEYSRLTSGIGNAGLIQMFGDVTHALAMPSAAQGRRVPWVAAIKGYGASIDLSASGLAMQFHLDTTGRSLTPSQLPVASGSTQPGVAGTAPIQMGLRNLIQPIHFIEAAVQSADAKQYATFTKKVGRLKARTGFDLNAFVAMLTGTFDVSSDTKTTLARVGVSDPASVSAMLKKLAAAPSLAFSKGTRVVALGGGLYDVREASGTELTLGVAGDQLLVGKATPAQLRAFARAPDTDVPGASGSLAFRIGIQDLLHLVGKTAPTPAAQQYLKLLGDVTGSVSATPSGVNGTAKLAIK
jgi:hypothetical protein